MGKYKTLWAAEPEIPSTTADCMSGMACGHTYLGIDYCNIDRLPTTPHITKIVDKYPSIVVPSSSLKTSLKRHPVTRPVPAEEDRREITETSLHTDYSRVFDKQWLLNIVNSYQVQHDYDNSAPGASDLWAVRTVE